MEADAATADAASLLAVVVGVADERTTALTAVVRPRVLAVLTQALDAHTIQYRLEPLDSDGRVGETFTVVGSVARP